MTEAKLERMDFDHRDPREKRYTVSRMIGRAGWARIMAEVAKCDIVCANCHRDRTYRRREASSSEREKLSWSSASLPSWMSRVRIPSPAPIP